MPPPSMSMIHPKIPPRAGRCIEIRYESADDAYNYIPPRAGRCIEILFTPTKKELLDSSPCGEVY